MKETALWIIVILLGVLLSEIAYSADSTSNIYYKDQPPASAISPSLSIGIGNDVCIVTRSGAIGTALFNASSGFHVEDKACTRRKNAKLLASLGLRVSATALMCQDNNIFLSMISAGSPCPINGKIGDEAIKEYRKRGILDENNNVIKYPSYKPVKFSVDNPQSVSRGDFGQPTK